MLGADDTRLAPWSIPNLFVAKNSVAQRSQPRRQFTRVMTLCRTAFVILDNNTITLRVN